MLSRKRDKKQFCLLMDEMKIKSGLAFSKSSGKLIGFCDLGNVSAEIDNLSPACPVNVISQQSWHPTC